MNSKQIATIIKELPNSPYKTILITGPWGVGKTFEIRKEVSKNNKVIYISLFGKNTIDEIVNSMLSQLYDISVELGNKQFKRKSVLKKGYNFIAQNTSLSAFGVSVTLPSLKFGLIKSLNVFENLLIIFDDLERKSKSIGYEDLLGFITEIGTETSSKIIMVADLNRIEDVQGKDEYELWSSFSEKVIQKKYSVSSFCLESQEEVIKKCFEDYGDFDYLTKSNEFFTIHSIKNLRTIEKSVHFLLDSLNHLNSENLSQERFNDLLWVCFSIVVEVEEKLYFNKLDEEKETTRKWLTNEVVIIETKYLDSFLGMKPTSKLIPALYEIYVNNGDYYHEIDYHIYNLNKETQKPIYLLSFEEIQKRVDQEILFLHKPVTNEMNIKKYIDIINSVNFWSSTLDKKVSFNDKQIYSNLDTLILNHIEMNCKDYYNSIDFRPGLNIQENTKKYVEYSQNESRRAYYVYMFEEVKSAFSIGDFSSYMLLKKIEDSFYISKSEDSLEINNLLFDYMKVNDFFIPDLSRTIESDTWTWASFIQKISLRFTKEQRETFDILIDTKMSKVDLATKYKFNAIFKSGS